MAFSFQDMIFNAPQNMFEMYVVRFFWINGHINWLGLIGLVFLIWYIINRIRTTKRAGGGSGGTTIYRN